MNSIIRIFIFLITLAICNSCVGSAHYLSDEISHYNGDGTIKEISLHYLLKPVKGYEIEFNEFELNAQYENTYQISKLPLEGETGIYLVINDPYPQKLADARNKTNKAIFAFELYDSRGKIIQSQKAHLSKLWWSSHGFNQEAGHALFDLESSFFEAHKNEVYTLKVKYTPSDFFTSETGHVYVRKGGRL